MVLLDSALEVMSYTGSEFASEASGGGYGLIRSIVSFTILLVRLRFWFRRVLKAWNIFQLRLEID